MSFLLLILVIAWSSFWLVTSRQMEAAIVTWFNKKHSVLERSYDEIIKSGFPNRIDIAIHNFSLTDDKNDLLFSAELVQLLTLVYNKKHLIKIVKPPLKIKLNKNYLNIHGHPIKSSLKLNSNNKPLESISEGQNLKIKDHQNNLWMVSHFLLAAKEESLETYRAHLTINDIIIPQNLLPSSAKISILNSTIKKISINSKVKLIKGLENYQRFIGPIRVADLDIDLIWDFINISINGDLYLSNKGLITGYLAVTPSDLQSLLLILKNSNFFTDRLFKRSKAALTFLASQSKGKEKAISFTIKIKENNLFLGPLKLGKIKPISIF